MAWTCSVVLDIDKAAERIGTVTAVWDDGLPTQFIFGPARVSLATAEDRTAFVAAARAALQRRDNGSAVEATVAANLAALLNS